MEELQELLPISVGMQPAHRVCESASMTVLAATSEEALAGTHRPVLRLMVLLLPTECHLGESQPEPELHHALSNSARCAQLQLRSV